MGRSRPYFWWAWRSASTRSQKTVRSSTANSCCLSLATRVRIVVTQVLTSGPSPQCRPQHGAKYIMAPPGNPFVPVPASDRPAVFARVSAASATEPLWKGQAQGP